MQEKLSEPEFFRRSDKTNVQEFLKLTRTKLAMEFKC